MTDRDFAQFRAQVRAERRERWLAMWRFYFLIACAAALAWVLFGRGKDDSSDSFPVMHKAAVVHVAVLA